MRRSILTAALLAGIAVFFFIGTTHATELDSLTNVVKIKTAELNADPFGFEITKMNKDSVPQFLDYLLSHHLRDTMAVYTMATTVKEIAHAEHTILSLMAQSGMMAEKVATQGKWRQEHVMAMIEAWFFNENAHDSPSVNGLIFQKHSLNID